MLYMELTHLGSEAPISPEITKKTHPLCKYGTSKHNVMTKVTLFCLKEERNVN